MNRRERRNEAAKKRRDAPYSDADARRATVDKLAVSFAEAFRDKRYTYDDATVEKVKALMREYVTDFLKTSDAGTTPTAQIRPPQWNGDGSFTIPMTVPAGVLDVVIAPEPTLATPREIVNFEVGEFVYPDGEGGVGGTVTVTEVRSAATEMTTTDGMIEQMARRTKENGDG